MRIISGQWKGRRLKSPGGDAVRPTTDRVKEAMFNILGPVVVDCLFLDLCCGAGGLGIEAISRGARMALLVDQSQKSLDLARENLVACGASPDRYRLIRAEATAWLAGWKPGSGTDPVVVVADPPYQSPAAGAIMGEMERLRLLPGFVAGIVEHGPRTPDLLSGPKAGEIWATRRYGESHLAVIRSPATDPSEGE